MNKMWGGRGVGELNEAGGQAGGSWRRGENRASAPPSIYVCVYIYIYIYIYTHTHTNIHTHTHFSSVYSLIKLSTGIFSNETQIEKYFFKLNRKVLFTYSSNVLNTQSWSFVKSPQLESYLPPSCSNLLTTSRDNVEFRRFDFLPVSHAGPVRFFK